MLATRRAFYQSTRVGASCGVPDFQSHVYATVHSTQPVVDRSPILDRSILRTVSRLNGRGSIDR